MLLAFPFGLNYSNSTENKLNGLSLDLSSGVALSTTACLSCVLCFLLKKYHASTATTNGQTLIRRAALRHTLSITYKTLFGWTLVSPDKQGTATSHKTNGGTRGWTHIFEWPGALFPGDRLVKQRSSLVHTTSTGIVELQYPSMRKRHARSDWIFNCYQMLYEPFI